MRICERAFQEVGKLKFEVEIKFAVAGCGRGSTFFLLACSRRRGWEGDSRRRLTGTPCDQDEHVRPE